MSLLNSILSLLNSILSLLDGILSVNGFRFTLPDQFFRLINSVTRFT
jgi:hypothetical protein